MLRVFRHCLVLLLMLTLPLQGVSATLMAVIPMHEAGMLTGAEDCHGHVAQSMQDDDSTGQQGLPGKPAPMKTKACGSCCAGLMAPLSTSFHPALRLAGRQPMSEVLAPEGIIPALFERPPRQLS